MENIYELLNNENFVWGAMSILVLCVSQLLKLPIKIFTNKIKNEKIRELVNTTIMIIPLALGILFDFAFCSFYLNIPFSVEQGLKVGATAVTLYGMLERIVKGATSKSTQETLKLADDMLADGKVNGDDMSAVQSFFNRGK